MDGSVVVGQRKQEGAIILQLLHRYEQSASQVNNLFSSDVTGQLRTTTKDLNIGCGA